MSDSNITLDAIAGSARNVHSTIEDMVHSVIREAIFSGVFAPGERLQQDHIAEVLNVSRMPVRASLRQLEAEGLVELRPYRGAIVRILSPREVEEIYEMRTLLESFLLNLVVKNITDEQVDRLMALVITVDTEDTPMRWMEARQTFYNELYGIAGRPRMARIVMGLRTELGPYWMSVRLTDDPKGHMELVERIRDRDVDGAIEWLTDHLNKVSAALQKLIRESPPENSFEKNKA